MGKQQSKEDTNALTESQEDHQALSDQKKKESVTEQEFNKLFIKLLSQRCFSIFRIHSISRIEQIKKDQLIKARLQTKEAVTSLKYRRSINPDSSKLGEFLFSNGRLYCFQKARSPGSGKQTYFLEEEPMPNPNLSTQKLLKLRKTLRKRILIFSPSNKGRKIDLLTIYNRNCSQFFSILQQRNKFETIKLISSVLNKTLGRFPCVETGEEVTREDYQQNVWNVRFFGNSLSSDYIFKKIKFDREPESGKLFISKIFFIDHKPTQYYHGKYYRLTPRLEPGSHWYYDHGDAPIGLIGQIIDIGARRATHQIYVDYWFGGSKKASKRFYEQEKRLVIEACEQMMESNQQYKRMLFEGAFLLEEPFETLYLYIDPVDSSLVLLHLKNRINPPQSSTKKLASVKLPLNKTINLGPLFPGREIPEVWKFDYYTILIKPKKGDLNVCTDSTLNRIKDLVNQYAELKGESADLSAEDLGKYDYILFFNIVPKNTTGYADLVLSKKTKLMEPVPHHRQRWNYIVFIKDLEAGEVVVVDVYDLTLKHFNRHYDGSGVARPAVQLT